MPAQIPYVPNTILPDTDMVYVRAAPDEDEDLPEIAFEDMEPIEGFDIVGIEPHTAIAISPVAEFDCIGVAPYGAVTATPMPAFSRSVIADLEPDSIPTEEYGAWEDDEPSEAVAL